MNNDQNKTCNFCNGVGKSICNCCQGTGIYTNLNSYYIFRFPIPDVRLCQNCNGTGRSRCIHCNGTGKKINYNNNKEKK